MDPMSTNLVPSRPTLVFRLESFEKDLKADEKPKKEVSQEDKTAKLAQKALIEQRKEKAKEFINEVKQLSLEKQEQYSEKYPKTFAFLRKSGLVERLP